MENASRSSAVLRSAAEEAESRLSWNPKENNANRSVSDFWPLTQAEHPPELFCGVCRCSACKQIQAKRVLESQHLGSQLQKINSQKQQNSRAPIPRSSVHRVLIKFGYFPPEQTQQHRIVQEFSALFPYALFPILKYVRLLFY